MRTNLLRSAALVAALAAPFAAPAAFAQSSSDIYSQSQAQVAQPTTMTSPMNPYGQSAVSDHGWNGFIHRTPEGVTHYGSEDYGFQGRSSQY